jgi:hypothetical protein
MNSNLSEFKKVSAAFNPQQKEPWLATNIPGYSSGSLLFKHSIMLLAILY